MTQTKPPDPLPIHIVIGPSFPSGDSPVRQWVRQYAADHFAGRSNVHIVTMGNPTGDIVPSVPQHSPPIVLDGVDYRARPVTGSAVDALGEIGHSFTAPGERFDYATRFVADEHNAVRGRHGLIVSDSRLEPPLVGLDDDEDDVLGIESIWRGIVVCHGISQGNYDLMRVSLDYLCKRYEHVPLNHFLADVGPTK